MSAIVTVPLIDRATNELAEVCGREDLSEADIVNRAVSLYAFVSHRLQAGDRLAFLREDGTVQTVEVS